MRSPQTEPLLFSASLWRLCVSALSFVLRFAPAFFHNYCFAEQKKGAAAKAAPLKRSYLKTLALYR